MSNDRKILLLHVLMKNDEQIILKDIENIQKRILRLTH